MHYNYVAHQIMDSSRLQTGQQQPIKVVLRVDSWKLTNQGHGTYKFIKKKKKNNCMQQPAVHTCIPTWLY